MVVISNLKRAGGQAEMHAAAASGWLSGAVPKRTEAEDLACGTSIDQVLAQQVGQSSPFPSLEFGTEDFTGYVGGCTPGYSCAYHDAIAWASPTRPLPMEINPRGAFERLFGDGGSDAQRRATCARTAASSTAFSTTCARCRRGSARTTARAWTPTCRTCARSSGAFSATRRSSAPTSRSRSRSASPTRSRRTRALMTDLLALAYQTELTHIFTFMMSREGSQRTFGPIGVPDPWHVTSHHGDKAEKVAQQRQDQRVLSADGRATAREAAGDCPTATDRCSITR